MPPLPLQLPPKFGFENKRFHNVKIFDVVDGDTLKCTIDLGGENVFGREVWVTVRLCEIDAPELKGETVCEKVCATIAFLTLADCIVVSSPPSSRPTTFLKDYVREISAVVLPVPLEKADEDLLKKHQDQIVTTNKKFKELVSEFLKINFSSSTSSASTFTLETKGMDLYGRVIGKIYYSCGGGGEEATLNQILCGKGVVRYYKGNKCRDKWCLEELYKIIRSL